MITTNYSQANVTLNQTSMERQALSVSGISNAAETKTIGTVPANKRWLIVGCSMSIDVAGAVQNYVVARVNAQTILTCSAGSGAGSANAGNNAISFDYLACPIATAGQTVDIVTQGSRTNVCFTYIEESV